MIGIKYGHLTVISIDEPRIAPSGRKHLTVKCKCDCGNITVKDAEVVRHGHATCCSKKCNFSPSCEQDSHKTALYAKWKNMKARCNIPSCPTYKYYGARGISICSEWQGKNGYLHFKKWSLENGYEANKELTIDRIDVNGNYEPSNCRWVTRDVQDNNRRDSRYYTHNGKTQTLSQWSRECGISFKCLDNRIKYGWDFEEAISTPPSHSNAHLHDKR